MNALAQSLLGVTKGYLGPAAQQFLSAELRALGVNANSVEPEHIVALSERVREHAVRLMGDEKASDLADALARCHGTVPIHGSGHRLASDAAARLLESGRLRQAEKAFGELVEKHGEAEAYKGLAHAQIALEDEGAALVTLRDGAARFAGAGDRATAVSLLAEAVQLSPTDLSAHRRLAAALANQGDLPGAVEEYARFVDVAVAAGDSRRALLELAYGRETLGDLPGLVVLVDRVTGAHSRVDGPRPAGHSRVDGPRPAAPRADEARHAARPAPLEVPIVKKPEPVRAAPPAAARTRPDASQTTVVLKSASTVTHAQQGDLDTPVDVMARAGFVKRAPKPARPAVDVDAQLSTLPPLGSGIAGAAIAASRAALLTSARDPRATGAAIDAARRLLALGKPQSASDVLLDYIGHGFTDREAQRILIEVDCALGRRDVAREKCSLLSQAYRLDGHADVAEDVERLAKIL